MISHGDGKIALAPGVIEYDTTATKLVLHGDSQQSERLSTQRMTWVDHAHDFRCLFRHFHKGRLLVVV